MVRSHATAGSSQVSIPGHIGRSQRPHEVAVSGASMARAVSGPGPASRLIRVSSVHATWPDRGATSITSAPAGPVRSRAMAVVLPRPPPRFTPMKLVNARATFARSFVAR